MVKLGTFSQFRDRVRWVIMLGLSLASVVDIITTGSMFVLLRHSRTGVERLDQVLDSLMLYAFETGSLTCAVTIIIMIFWVVMSTNLIFLGFHFVIGKLYATSFLVALNTRARLRRGALAAYVYPANSQHRDIPMVLFGKHGKSNAGRIISPRPKTELQVSVEHCVEYTVGV
ncbi:hypothetical protein C8J56DRAFT_957453 [Mycena floridula]|nr:hypothetical protein C8J56DRAFT_957453 [Mycena floridula]